MSEKCVSVFPPVFVVRTGKLLCESNYSRVWRSWYKSGSNHGFGLRQTAVKIQYHESRELQILQHVQAPFIIRVLAAARYKSRDIIYMQYWHQDLSHAMPIGENHVRLLLPQMCKAIQHVHACGYVHGDIKPDNFLVNAELTQCVLTDFGLAKHYPVRMNHISGSPDYVAPESYECGIYNTGTDCWALGITIYTLVHGNEPYTITEPYETSYAKKIINFPQTFSQSLCDVLRKILCSARQRCTIADVMRHRWTRARHSF